MLGGAVGSRVDVYSVHLLVPFFLLCIWLLEAFFIKVLICDASNFSAHLWCAEPWAFRLDLDSFSLFLACCLD